MIKKVLLIFISVLIALQSVSAVVDSHQQHQSGDKHLTFEHEHNQSSEINRKSVNNELKFPSTNQYDCHHCCHCHASHLNYLSSNQAILLPLVTKSININYQNSAKKGVYATLFRPPKV